MGVTVPGGSPPPRIEPFWKPGELAAIITAHILAGLRALGGCNQEPPPPPPSPPKPKRKGPLNRG